MRFGLIAIGEVGANGKPSYAAILPSMKRGNLTINVAGGAKVSIEKLGDSGPELLTFDKGMLPLTMAFMVPLPKEPARTLGLRLAGAEPVALSELSAGIARAAPPLPKAMEPLAKRAFAAKKMYFIWCDKPLCKPSELQLRILANPQIKQEDLLLGDEDVAVVTHLVYTAEGHRVPITSCSLGPRFSMNDSQFTGAIRASIRLIRGTDARWTLNANPARRPLSRRPRRSATRWTCNWHSSGPSRAKRMSATDGHR